jgi:hypothetical protein
MFEVAVPTRQLELLDEIVPVTRLAAIEFDRQGHARYFQIGDYPCVAGDGFNVCGQVVESERIISQGTRVYKATLRIYGKMSIPGQVLAHELSKELLAALISEGRLNKPARPDYVIVLATDAHWQNICDCLNGKRHAVLKL